jgi:putative DNA primase/helicase
LELVLRPSGHIERAFKHALGSESLWRLENMVELAKGSVTIEVEDLDRDAHLLNVANGTLDLKTGELREFRREDYITRILPTAYVKGAVAPTWQKFLNTIMDGKAHVTEFLQRCAGYSLTGFVHDHAMIICYGVGANGKSTFLGVLHEILGGYAQGMAPETIMAKKHDGMRNDIARMVGVRFISAIESKRGRQLDESMVKQLTGGDVLTGEFKFKEQFDFLPTHKLWFGTNHKPTIKDTTNSIWRRLKLVVFGVVIPKDEQVRDLKERLLAEAEGILAWAVEGCLAWRRVGLQEPGEVLADTEQYRLEQDSLTEFVGMCLEVAPKGWAAISEIYAAYEAWADEHGGAEHAGEERLSAVAGYLVSTYALQRKQRKVDGKNAKGLLGIRLRPEPAGPAPGPDPEPAGPGPGGDGNRGNRGNRVSGSFMESTSMETPGTTVTTVTGYLIGGSRRGFRPSKARYRRAYRR